MLAVARRADPDAWRDRARDPAAWQDEAALTRLAESAQLAAQPASFLGALGERLHAQGGNGTTFLARVQRAHPDDFWISLTLARVMQGGADPKPRSPPTARRWSSEATRPPSTATSPSSRTLGTAGTRPSATARKPSKSIPNLPPRTTISAWRGKARATGPRQLATSERPSGSTPSWRRPTTT